MIKRLGLFVSVYRYHDLQSDISCSDNFEIGTDKSKKRTKEVCEDRCTQQKHCNFYSYTNDNLCNLFAKCKSEATVNHESGTTYRRPCKYS